MDARIRKSHCMCGDVELEIEGAPAVMAYCHCESCRRWLSAPIHASALFPTDRVRVSKGGELLGVHKRTEASLRHFCKRCGAAVLIRHPQLGMTDVPAFSIEGLDYRPTLHVNYGEKVMSMRDGLPKYKDFPESFGGSDQKLPE